MTSGQKSSDRARKPNTPPEIETLAGAFHPHAIEVQDFSHYALIIDVRTPEEYEDDHIPGAVQFSPAVVNQGPLLTGLGEGQTAPLIARENGVWIELPATLEALVSPLKLDKAILVYCGRGGLDSQPVARALRWRGWVVDVLPGGWINYRRWVQAGLEVLPRMLTFKVISTSLWCEADLVLNALATVGHQVLNVEALMGRRRGAIALRDAKQPSQAWFESQLLKLLRAFDPRRPVWVGDVELQVGELRLPGALRDALSGAPMAELKVPLEERVQRWLEDERGLQQSPHAVIEAIAALEPAPNVSLLERLKDLATRGLTGLASSVLADYFDQCHAASMARRLGKPVAMAPLVADSLEPARLASAVGDWQPMSNGPLSN
jgi:tRNA 2-selenouridine synthase